MKNLNTRRQLALHSEFALAIKGAKKALFKYHREGGDLDKLIDVFADDVRIRLKKIVSSSDAPNHVVATLPNGEEVELYGDAVDLAKEKDDRQANKSETRKRVAAAIMELLTNDATPDDLYDDLEKFLCDAGSGSIAGRYTEVEGGLQALEHLIAFAEWEKENPNWPSVGEDTIGGAQ